MLPDSVMFFVKKPLINKSPNNAPLNHLNQIFHSYFNTLSVYLTR